MGTMRCRGFAQRVRSRAVAGGCTLHNQSAANLPVDRIEVRIVSARPWMRAQLRIVPNTRTCDSPTAPPEGIRRLSGRYSL